MAFGKTSLNLYGSSPYGTAGKNINFHTYATPDAPATVLAAGYFNGAREKLKPNDVIDAMTNADGTGDRLHLRVVLVPVGAGDVTVAVDAPASGS
ncbi:hypothetical protein JYU29_04975 [Tianweitania sp. BSSL-BM11]|uniref:Uncharacterized protein n=1 Tax=Tianweitania aestuarii TaxID=2814886 RepID=A0ABS5RSK8_9HYPH|nr:hypothetical protein [Tianweitania aestuarii]MBS9720040.1 hypothetical protein [Tianweitania aestuarii]